MEATMELWNDFEGKTVDGRFRLDRLIGPKGRSAYFTTTDATGAPAMIRLIESLNDEEEILSRWRLVTGMKQEHLVEVLASGQTVLDGTHLVYAVMEPTDMELADVLRERALTAEETRQIGWSVADGLEALHAKGLVHEHVEADNVLAQGETVKLRSDVIREAPEGPEGAVMRSKDVRDLSTLLMQCLTRHRYANGTRLPAPFDELVRKGESGEWGLKEIAGTLRPATTAPRPATPARAVPAAAAATVTGRPSATPAVKEASTPSAPTAASVEASTPAAVASRLANQAPFVAAGPSVGSNARSRRDSDRIVLETQDENKRKGLLIGVVAGVLVLLLLGIYFFRAGRAGEKRTVVQDTPSAVTDPQQSSENRPPAHDAAIAPVPHRVAEKPSAAVGGDGRAPRSGHVVTGAAAAGSSAQWRVVAFTYNREDQASAKAREIGARHPGLKPEVFSPSGHAPYLVTLGGWMSAEQASSLKSRARSDGMPRDVYAQNYHAR